MGSEGVTIGMKLVSQHYKFSVVSSRTEGMKVREAVSAACLRPGRATRLENFEAVAFYGNTDFRRVKSSRLDKGAAECFHRSGAATSSDAYPGELWSRLERTESNLEK